MEGMVWLFEPIWEVLLPLKGEMERVFFMYLGLYYFFMRFQNDLRYENDNSNFGFDIILFGSFL